jgi:class 3 adenylate cyclase
MNERSRGRIEVKHLGRPEAVVTHPLGETQQVRLAGTVVSRSVLQPGWSWVEHAQPTAGSASCQLFHRGFLMTGRFGVRMDAGEQFILEPDAVFDIGPGHVTWVEGDEPVVMVDWAGGPGFGAEPGGRLRVLSTILFTDIVDSTARAQVLGDATWNRTLAMHNDVVRSVVTTFGGNEIETAGDSFLVVFDSAERAIRCGLALVDAVAAIGLQIRVGIHSGEVATEGGQVRGVAVHTAARIVSLAEPGEVLVSTVTRDLAEGAALAFEDRGAHRLKGIRRDQELFAVRG